MDLSRFLVVIQIFTYQLELYQKLKGNMFNGAGYHAVQADSLATCMLQPCHNQLYVDLGLALLPRFPRFSLHFYFIS